MRRKEFSLYSLCSGASSAAANTGLNDRLFKSQLRWGSQRAKDGYVDNNIETLLPVSGMLGL